MHNLVLLICILTSLVGLCHFCDPGKMIEKFVSMLPKLIISKVHPSVKQKKTKKSIKIYIDIDL